MHASAARETGVYAPRLSDFVGAVQRLAMSEASPLYKKLSEEEKAGYVKLAEGTHAYQSRHCLRMGSLGLLPVVACH